MLIEDMDSSGTETRHAAAVGNSNGVQWRNRQGAYKGHTGNTKSRVLVGENVRVFCCVQKYRCNISSRLPAPSVRYGRGSNVTGPAGGDCVVAALHLESSGVVLVAGGLVKAAGERCVGAMGSESVCPAVVQLATFNCNVTGGSGNWGKGRDGGGGHGGGHRRGVGNGDESSMMGAVESCGTRGEAAKALLLSS